MTKDKALKEFNENILPFIISCTNSDDYDLKQDMWQKYIKSLYKYGKISEFELRTWKL